jgi:hypothetical protein
MRQCREKVFADCLSALPLCRLDLDWTQITSRWQCKSKLQRRRKELKKLCPLYGPFAFLLESKAGGCEAV